jgi:putative ABC transport system permease protein
MTAEVVWLLLLLGCLVPVGYLAVARPVLRRLAFRQVVRRPGEAVIVVLGSLLGTALIVASLAVGDSLDRSVRQTAYDVLGPIDETVRATSPIVADEAVSRLRFLDARDDVDGVLVVRQDLAAAARGIGAARLAEPRVIVTELDFRQAARFGGPRASGLTATDPGPHGVVVNETLADVLDLRRGDRVTFYLYSRARVFTVTEVVPATGLAGSGFGATVNRDAFFAPGVLSAAASAAGEDPSTAVLISNAGGVEDGVVGTTTVTRAIRVVLGGLATHGALVATPKREVLDAAAATGDQLGSLFLFIASFAIIAGILLLVNVFVMLADERKGQLGMLRAMGLRRRRLTAEFALEGAIYAVVATLLGTGLGLLLGRVVVVVAVRILNAFERGDNKLDIVFQVQGASLVEGASAGFVISFVAVVLTSVRIARMNIIAAIRDLPADTSARPRRRLTQSSVGASALLAAASVPVLTTSQGPGTYLVPALTALAAVPWLRRLLPMRVVMTAVASAILCWGLVAHLVRPHMYDEASTATYVVLGTMLSFAAVVLISLHQRRLLAPLRPLIDRPGQRGLAARLATTYPTARAFRTGATLAMYCIVVLVIVLLAQISAMIHAGEGAAVTDASGGWTLRADFNPVTPPGDLYRALREQSAGTVVESSPLVTAVAQGTDPLHRSDAPLAVMAVGFQAALVDRAPTLEARLPRLRTDADAWRLALRDPSYVLVDTFYGENGGPPGEPIAPGDRIRLTDPRTGTQEPHVVAGVIKDGTAFYGVTAGEFRYPVLMSSYGVISGFGVDARQTSMLLRTAPGTDPAVTVRRLQSTFLANGLVVTDIADSVRRTYAANTQMFRLMQGYLAIGLLVAITGLGVVMVRSVRERRRTIGVLRALGVQSSTVRHAFLGESLFIAMEGVVVGTVLGVLTTWLLYQNSPAFETMDAAFPVAWMEIATTVGLAFVASLLATLVPARRAAAVRPALAVRTAE